MSDSPIYEILIRGRDDGTLAAAHVARFVPDGTDAAGLPRFRLGVPAPLAVADVAAVIGEQQAALVAQAATADALAEAAAQLTAERDALASRVQEQERRIGELTAAVLAARAQPAE